MDANDHNDKENSAPKQVFVRSLPEHGWTAAGWTTHLWTAALWTGFSFTSGRVPNALEKTVHKCVVHPAAVHPCSGNERTNTLSTKKSLENISTNRYPACKKRFHMQTLTPCPTDFSLYAPIDVRDPFFQEIKALKKNELHTHLSGSISASCLEKIAIAQDKKEHYDNFLEQRKILAKRVEYKDCFRFFGPIEEILGVKKPCKTEEEAKKVCANIVKAVRSVCRQYARDNVTYVEIRTSLKRVKEGGDFQPYLDAVLKGIRQGEKKHKETKLKVNLLLSLRRSTSEADCKETLKLAMAHKYQVNSKKHKVVGLDLSGNSTEGDGVAATNALKEAIKVGFPVSIHIGETSEEEASRQQDEMTDLTPQRVGHAVVVHNREILGDTPIEFCPSSAYYVTMHKNPEDHPAYEDILNARRSVFICGDDLAMIEGLTLSHEIYRVAKHLNLSIEQVKAMQKTAKEHRFDRAILRLSQELNSKNEA